MKGNELTQPLPRARPNAASWMWIYTAVIVGAMLAYAPHALSNPTPAGGTRQGPIGTALFVVVGLPISCAAWLWVMLNVLRLVRVLPPFALRRRSATTAVIGKPWAVFRGRGIVLREGEAVRFTCNPAPRFKRIAGRAFMFQWSVKADGGQFSLLSPLALPPGSHWVVLEFPDRGKPVLAQSN